MGILKQYFKCVLLLAISGLAVSVPVEQDTPKDDEVSSKSACTEIKCPPVSKPLCVELKYQPTALHTRSVYIEVINRCELKYITCYGGVAKAKEIPMSYCDHGKNITSDMHALQVMPLASKIRKLRKNKEVMKQMKNKKQLHKKDIKTSQKLEKIDRKINKKEADMKKRVKRETLTKEQELEHLKEAKKALFDDTSVALKKFKIKRVPKKYKIGSSYFAMRDKKNILRAGNDVDETTQNAETTNIFYVKGPHDDIQESDLEEEGQILIPGEKGTASEKKKKSDDENKSDYAENGPGQYVSIAEYFNEEDPRELLVREDAALAAVETDREEYDIRSQEDTVTEKASDEEHESECPKSCPARGVMLCGRCKDHIYRTFLSECHMRMFDCHHPDEKLELVSRLPCAMSGPYLEDLRVPDGVLHEPGDDDVVLRYLRCKDYAQSKLRPWSTINCDFN